MSAPSLPVFRPSLELLKKRARALHRGLQVRDTEALNRFLEHHPGLTSETDAEPSDLTLRDAQLVVAREQGHDNWTDLKRRVEAELAKDDPKSLREERRREMTSPPAEIDAVVERACGSPPKSRERQLDNFSNEAWRIVTEAGDVVCVRAHWYQYPIYFDGEQWALEQCERVGVPAPRMLLLEHGFKGRPDRSISVRTWIEGQQLHTLVDKGATEEELAPILRDQGRAVARMNQVPAPAFGRLGKGLETPAHTWRAHYVDGLDRERLAEACHNAEVPLSEIESALDLLETHAAVGDGQPPRLLHGDLKDEHVIVHEGKFAGLIDFEFASGGDPALHACWTRDVPSGWWDAWLGIDRPPLSRVTFREGYSEVADVTGFEERSAVLSLRQGLGGFAYHGVNDVGTRGMMDFMRWRLRRDLDRARTALG